MQLFLTVLGGSFRFVAFQNKALPSGLEDEQEQGLPITVTFPGEQVCLVLGSRVWVQVFRSAGKGRAQVLSDGVEGRTGNWTLEWQLGWSSFVPVMVPC